MARYCLPGFIFWLLLGVAVPGLVCAQAPAGQEEEPKPYKGPFFAKPSGTPLPVQYKVVDVTLDGYTSTLGELSCNLFTATTYAVKGWKQVNLPRTSLAFQSTYYPGVYWAICLWAEDSFLPSLSTRSLKGYAEWLNKTYPNQVEILNEDTGFRRGAIRTVFNRMANMVAYTKVNLQTSKPELHEESFVIFQKHLLEFKIWGPEAEVRKVVGNYAYYPSNLSLQTPDPDYNDEIMSMREDEPEPEAN
ncbi:MAG: hypothetical protein AAGF10_05755 [Verrucomicrobiota bacterium]